MMLEDDPHLKPNVWQLFHACTYWKMNDGKQQMPAVADQTILVLLQMLDQQLNKGSLRAEEYAG